jgi:hypothetical protein
LTTALLSLVEETEEEEEAVTEGEEEAVTKEKEKPRCT